MIIPSPQRGANCWVVDGTHTFFDALTWMDQLNYATVKVLSLDDLTRACATCAMKSGAVEFLAVFGHGTGGYQAVGGGIMQEHSGTRSLWYKGATTKASPSNLMGPAEGKIRALNGLLSPNATILLAGCNVGESGVGTGLLTTVSCILGNRRVQAFENAVYWWTGVMVGSLKEARGSSVSSSLSAYTMG